MNIFVTGGAGFIGSNFIRYILRTHQTYRIINYDLLTYSGNLDNLQSVHQDSRYFFVQGDIQNRELAQKVILQHRIDCIINFAAESHVDRSIENSTPFFNTNVMGTVALLEIVKEYPHIRMLQVSTDEVYGSLGNKGLFTETTPLAPSSPYSSSKASADMIALSYFKTYGTHVSITRCSNNYGPYQYPEKLIPLMIIQALKGKQLPVYGDGKNVRDWLHVEDHCRALDAVMHRGKAGEVYNIGGNQERTNIEVVRSILQQLGKSETAIEFVADRLGHDRRYAIDASKIKKELGWSPTYTFEEGLRETIEWYCENELWWSRLQQK
ncbi:dTDP-glucose 4,6-dehydratase [Bacillus cytotoxicus]|nr:MULTISPECIES: dTDP-glucose 4,6-dehydratase [Bacillus cereus group]ABS21271.1 dTDP-glucose 4,6-dehydratase [Bacillus cytotoxicus NVH 391-98]AWC27915.1 dTDP-glucose 4,6-dehydratase [Bacillus cytotoxicus]AWC31963.1 dTDP-glucose 4,6-dehydratase [Bacillus cytotoxicus]AWC35996.1 dTDP-glucose 4,6-dehydratase [Bacillus cytotoxicus]AWC40703.1 dTDP-glucose 4,6-dehydratase [Bacillus cytotoxicus]